MMTHSIEVLMNKENSKCTRSYDKNRWVDESFRVISKLDKVGDV